jgi:hypothetical protein
MSRKDPIEAREYEHSVPRKRQKRRNNRRYRRAHLDECRKRAADYYETVKKDERKLKRRREQNSRAQQRRRGKVAAMRMAQRHAPGMPDVFFGFSVVTAHQAARPEFIFVHRGKRRVDVSLVEYENRKRLEA